MGRGPSKTKTTKAKQLTYALDHVKKDDGVEGEVVDEPQQHDRFGRPKVVTVEVKAMLKAAFGLGCPDREACAFAKISQATLYNFYKEDPEFKEYCKQLKLNPILKARMVVIEGIKDDKEFALKVLERMSPKQWSNRQIMQLMNDDDDDHEDLEDFSEIDHLIEQNYD